MRKKLPLIAALFVVSFGITVLIFDQTYTVSQVSRSIQLGRCGIEACADTQQPGSTHAKTVVIAGGPISVQKNQTVVIPANKSYQNSTFSLGTYLKTWQFYVDWLVWSLPPLGIAYVINSSHARQGAAK